MSTLVLSSYPVDTSTTYSDSVSALPQTSPFQVLIGVTMERIVALMGLMAEAAGSMEQSTNAELNAQKMSNTVNSLISDSEANDNKAEALPTDVVDYINDNQIVIDGVSENSDGSFKELDPNATYSTSQLTAIKGEFDVEATSYADSTSQTQLTIQEVAQSFSMCVSEISQLLSKSNQICSTIVNNLK
jgi:phage I-like protein